MLCLVEHWKRCTSSLAQIFQALLKLTVLSDGQKVTYHGGTSKSDFTLAGPRTGVKEPSNSFEMYHALKLRDKRFLHLVYTFEITKQNRVKTKKSRLVYMNDELGKQQIFRMDFEREPSSPYPAGHLHVYGTLPNYISLPDKKGNKLHHVHFPIIRPTLESVIRLLINDYGIDQAQDRAQWSPVLQYTESLFMDNLAKQSLGVVE